MKALHEIKWGEFFLSDIFSINATSSGLDRTKLSGTPGIIPYVTRSDRNNGCDTFVDFQGSSIKIDEGNVVTIGLDTQTVFYQHMVPLNIPFHL